VRCAARRSSSNGNVTSVAYFKYGDSTASATTVPTPIDHGTSYRLTTLARGSQFEGRLGTAAKISVAGVPSLNGLLQIRVRNIALHIHDIVAYQLGSP
jgi:hypothetical protein